ncbi:dihydropteroate synthase [Spirochaetota bacterium]
MGIVNVTPDSFYNGGSNASMDDIIARVDDMAAEGVDIIDIGGESSRPGSVRVSEEEEQKRVLPVIRMVREKYPDIIISVDTYKARVASKAVESGADIINDISSFSMDKDMIQVMLEYKKPVVLMHMQGTPAAMQKDPQYNDVVREIYDYLHKRIDMLMDKGFPQDKIIIDPGIGFGKTREHNIEIIRNIKKFHELKLPILIGASMKRLVGDITGRETAKRGAGSIGIHPAFQTIQKMIASTKIGTASLVNTFSAEKSVTLIRQST